METLFKTPFGSRLYGTFTETSDHDWKVIHLPDVRKLLIGDKVLKNVFYSTSSKEFKNNADDTDTEYIALQTLARDVVAGQAYAIEVAFAMVNADNIEGTEFLGRDLWTYNASTDTRLARNDAVRAFIKELLAKFLTSQMNGMVGYAYHQAKLYSAKGDRLNFLRELHQVMLDAIGRGEGSTTIHNLATEHSDNGYDFVRPLYALMKQYPDWFEFSAIHIDETKNKYYSFKVLKKTYLGTSKISHVSNLIEKAIGAYGSRANKAAENEGNDWKALSHAVRVTYQAIELLETGALRLPLQPHICDILKRIKAGEVDFEKVSNLLNANVDLIDGLKATTCLQPFTEQLREEFDEWLSWEMMSFYNL